MTAQDTIHPNSNSPISRLDQDALWRIFKINATLEPIHQGFVKVYPLDTTRYTSQVCRQWRELIIGSPSIWGGLIDLDLFNKLRTNRWRDEVMKRTCQSLLSVRGRVTSNHEPSRPFFRHLLTHHWPRIREIEVWIAPNLFETSFWDVFWQKPARTLEKFSLGYSISPGPMLQQSGRQHTLFSGQAPLLRSFHCKILQFDYQAPWISQLRSVTLSSPLTVTDVLDILCHTPCLQELDIDCGVVPLLVSPSRQPTEITLTNLRHLQIENTVRASLTLLEQIVPALKCELLLTAIDSDSNNISINDFRSLHPVISRFAESYFGSTVVTKLILSMSSERFFAFPFVLEKFTAPPFGIDISCRPRLPTGSAGLLLRAFLACRLTTITHLEFIPNSTCDIDSEDPALTGFILILTSVEKLTVSEYGLKLLNMVSLDNTLVFPSLTTVQLRYLTRATLKFPDTVILFLSRRKSAGVPVHYFDISHWAVGEAMHWSFLDVVEGLRVMWKANGVVREYVCGSGMRERLNLRYIQDF